jgi:hypothetical protein
MARRLVLLDFRLTGMVSSDIGTVQQVSVRTPIKDAFDQVAAHARKAGGLDDLLICCHGFEGVLEDFDGEVSFVSGGFGLELCQENLTLSNAAVVRSLHATPPLVRRIVVFSCAAADSQRAARAYGADGKRLMGEIALHSGARVVASTATQRYSMIPNISQWMFNAGSQNDWRIDFGDWEGAVFEFSPDDGSARQLKPAQHPRFDF